jgi:hypothetical protein
MRERDGGERMEREKEGEKRGGRGRDSIKCFTVLNVAIDKIKSSLVKKKTDIANHHIWLHKYFAYLHKERTGGPSFRLLMTLIREGMTHLRGTVSFLSPKHTAGAPSVPPK